MSSFTKAPSIAERFSRRNSQGGKKTPVVFKLKTGAQAVNIQPFSFDTQRLQEREWITAGKFRVVKVEKKLTGMYNLRHVSVTIEHVGVYRLDQAQRVGM